MRYELTTVNRLSELTTEPVKYADRRKAIKAGREAVAADNSLHCEILDDKQLLPDVYVDFDSETSRVTVTEM